MIYSKEEYQKMMYSIHQAIEEKRSITIQDAFALSVSYNAIISLYSQYYLKSLKQEYSSKLKSISNRILLLSSSSSSYASAGQSPTIPSVFQILQQGSPPPTSYSSSSAASSAATTASSSKTILTNPMTTSYYRLVKCYLEERFGPQMKISDFLINPSLIPEESLREELLYLIAHDLSDAPDISLIKESMGKQYEQLLIDLLNSYHFVYETEADMRKKGKPKTPDIWFTIPMATILQNQYELIPYLQWQNELMRNIALSPLLGDELVEDLENERDNFDEMNLSHQSNLANFSSVEYFPDETFPPYDPKQLKSEDDEDHYVIINWIDSKAMFADLETFQEHYQQLHGYYLRYGRGMVIYWHGIVEDLYSSDLYDGNIIIRDSFPEKWIFPTGEEASPLNPPTFQLQAEYQYLP